MLQFTPLKNVEKCVVNFELESRKVKAKLDNLNISSKIEGMYDLVALFGMCKTY